jgi:hypothetical protein
MNTTTNLLSFAANPYQFQFGAPNELNLRLNANGGLETLNTSPNGIKIKLADKSLSLSTLGLQVSSIY